MFCRKAKLQELRTKLKESCREVSFYKQRDEQKRTSNIRYKEYPYILLKDTNFMIIDLLDDNRTPAIYIYKVDRPAE